MTAKTVTDKGLRKAISHWLRSGMESSGLNQSTLADKSGVARETVWRLLHGKTDASEWTLRRLAQAIGREPPPSGEGRASRQTPAEEGRRVARIDRQDEAPAAGWLFGNPSEAEEQFLSFLRNIERTTRAMVGNPDLFSVDENRINQLAVCRAAVRSAELVGRPIPPWLTRIYNEVIGGAFR